MILHHDTIPYRCPAELLRKGSYALDLAVIKGLLIDMDGVLYRGQAPIPGADRFVAFLRCQGIPFLLLTNNSSLTPDQYVAKLGNMGIEARADEILTSAQATARYLAQQEPHGARMYVIGREGLRQALMKQGFVVVEGQADYVVVGWDWELTYTQLKQATLLIRAGARFIATNPDLTFPSEEGIIPGNGAILAALEVATDVKPLVIGKPQATIFQLALAQLGMDGQGVAVLGDRLETDVLGGQQMGLRTLFVLSGVTDEEMLARSTIRPDLVFEGVAHLERVWMGALGR
jgi:4-nitrophenyl phosphatase